MGVNKKKRVVIVGGGITGMTAAYYLQKQLKEQNLPVEIELIEASERLGGKVQTVRKDGFVIERGPDSFLARKMSATRLAEEVGLGDKLVYNSSGQSFVLVKGRLHPMPGGAIMGIPTKMAPFITSGLFSPVGKLRASLDLVLPKSGKNEDQSLGEFFRRRLGDEVVEHLIEPLLSGIYAGDIDKLSLMSTFPQFYAVEQKYRSLILGMNKSMPKTPKQTTDKTSKSKGMFKTISTGLESLVDEIESRLDGVYVQKGVRVNQINKNEQKYILKLDNGNTVNADSIVFAAPHKELPKIFTDYHFFNAFEVIPSTSVANVAMAFPKEAIKTDIEGTGFVVSRNNDYRITACTWTHKKWGFSTPEGYALLRCYVGKPDDEEIVSYSDDEIKEIVLTDLNKIMNIDSKPEFSYITRWHNAMPQYTVGHKLRFETVTKEMKKDLPGVFLAGSSYEGLGIPDCIDQGEQAVVNVLEYLKLTTI